jgi:hypothetical protein
MDGVRHVRLAALVCAVFAQACVSPASRDSEPNALQRANVLSKNQYGITIQHSEWGRPIAFRIADEHCASLRKAAVYLGSTHGYGPDQTSTWECR